MSQFKLSVHSSAEGRNSAALLSGQPHLGSSSDSSRCANTIAGSALVVPQMQYETIILWLPHSSQQSKGPRCSVHTTKTLQSDFSLVQNHQHLCLSSVFCFRSGVKCRSAPPGVLRSLKNHTVMVFVDCHHRAQFCSTAAIEMQKLWCLLGRGGGASPNNTFVFHVGFCGRAAV